MLVSSCIQNLWTLLNSPTVTRSWHKARRMRYGIEALESRTLLTIPAVTSIDLVGAPTANTGTVIWTATCNEAVTGVDPTDFSLVKSGSVGTTLIQVTGSGSTYTVTVSGVSGNGTLGLNLADNDSIQDVRYTVERDVGSHVSAAAQCRNP